MITTWYWRPYWTPLVVTFSTSDPNETSWHIWKQCYLFSLLGSFANLWTIGYLKKHSLAPKATIRTLLEISAGTVNNYLCACSCQKQVKTHAELCVLSFFFRPICCEFLKGPFRWFEWAQTHNMQMFSKFAAPWNKFCMVLVRMSPTESNVSCSLSALANCKKMHLVWNSLFHFFSRSELQKALKPKHHHDIKGINVLKA